MSSAENRSSNTEMVSFPRELSDELAELIAHRARVCGGGAFEIWEAICEEFGQPAEQLQGEPIMLTAVATLVDDGYGGLEASWLLEGGTAELFAGMTLLVADNAPDLCSEDGSAQLYPHADPGEVERLREALQLEQEASAKWQETAIRTSNKLAEWEALLEEAYRDGWNDGQEAIEQRYQTTPRTSTEGWVRFKADVALSASAEPSAPKCKYCGALGVIDSQEKDELPSGHYVERGLVSCKHCEEPSAPVEIDERAEFEASHVELFGCLPRTDDQQPDFSLSHHNRWMLWQARAALERKP